VTPAGYATIPPHPILAKIHVTHSILLAALSSRGKSRECEKRPSSSHPDIRYLPQPTTPYRYRTRAVRGMKRMRRGRGKNKPSSSSSQCSLLILEYTSFAGIINLALSAPTNLHPDCIALSCPHFRWDFRISQLCLALPY